MRRGLISKEVLLGTALGAVLLVLAVLQYRWIGQVSEADQARLESNLRRSVDRFVQDFDSELDNLTRALLGGGPGAPSATTADYANRLAAWRDTAFHSRIARRVWYVSRATPETGLSLETGREEALPAQLIAMLQRTSRFGGPQEVDGEIPALAIPAIRPGRGQPESTAWLLVELDSQYIGGTLLPDLAARHFGPDYRVAVVSRQNMPVFQSDPQEPLGASDVVGFLLSIRLGFGPPRGSQPGSQPGPPPGRPAFDRPKFKGRGPGLGGPPPQGSWLLLAAPKAGSLQTNVASIRQRNLTVSFGILLIMGVSIGLLVQSTRKSKRLASLQMEFVAGITHELKTPLAVISSASQNLADGVTVKEDQVKRYGSVIRDQGRRLTEMVEQILRFAGISAGQLDLRPVNTPLAPLVEQAIADTNPDFTATGVEVTFEPPANLPDAYVDPAAVVHCLRNLLANAAKHGGGSPVRVTAKTVGTQIEICIEDRGPGIEPSDLPHIFEPFYRGRRAIAEQIHGTGLGLSLVKQLIEAQGGTVSVHSQPGKGTTFQVRVPTRQA